MCFVVRMNGHVQVHRWFTYSEFTRNEHVTSILCTCNAPHAVTSTTSLNRVHLLVSFFFLFFLCLLSFTKCSNWIKYTEIQWHHCTQLTHTSLLKIEFIVNSFLKKTLTCHFGLAGTIVRTHTSVLLSIGERQQLLGSPLCDCVSFRCTNEFQNQTKW